jgi:hypothetical protein
MDEIAAARVVEDQRPGAALVLLSMELPIIPPWNSVGPVPS